MIDKQVIIEIDERQHTGYDHDDEHKRECVLKRINPSVTIIRVNPDAYIGGDDTRYASILMSKSSEFLRRYRIVHRYITSALAGQYHGLTIKLFYDGCIEH
jgi:hypothetical protein